MGSWAKQEQRGLGNPPQVQNRLSCARVLPEKTSVGLVLPVAPCLHQACLTWQGPAVPQNQSDPAPREAWGHLCSVTMAELATVSMSLWDTVITTGYPSTEEAERLKPCTILPPQPRRQCPACEGILPSHPPPCPRAKPWPWPCATGKECTGPERTALQGSGTRPDEYRQEESSGFSPVSWPKLGLQHRLQAGNGRALPPDASAQASPPCECNTCLLWTRSRGVPVGHGEQREAGGAPHKDISWLPYKLLLLSL